MYLLDTNIISELRKAQNNRADKQVVAWSNSVEIDQLFISAITILELEKGVLQVERKDAKQGLALRTWLEEQVIPTFSGKILAIDTKVAQKCARLHVPNPKSERDALIAATALVHKMTVVTRNIKDFKNSGVLLINPWRI